MNCAGLLLISAIAAITANAQDDVCADDSPFRYEVVKGDCLFRLAAASGTSVNQWLANNPRITDENWIEVGWILCAPAGAVVVPTEVTCDRRPTAQKGGNNQLPVVQPDDSDDNSNQLQPVTARPATRRTAPRNARNTRAPARRIVIVPTQGPVASEDNQGGGVTIDPFVFPLQNPGFRAANQEADLTAAASSPVVTTITSDDRPPFPGPVSGQALPSQAPTQFIQLPASITSNDVPSATRPPISQARVQQKPPVKSQPAAAIASISQAPGSIDPNVVQCQFFDSGFLNCLRGCTVDLFQWDVDANTGTKIMMRQCIENKPPAVHTWLSDDGILAPWLKPKLIPTGQAEKIIAACTFTRDRSYTCESATQCDARFQSVGSACSGATHWKGKTTEGDPLKRGSVLKGAISDISQDALQDDSPKQRKVRDARTPPFIPNRIFPKRPSGTAQTNSDPKQGARRKRQADKPTPAPPVAAAKTDDCAKTAKLCLIMRDAALTDPIWQTCYALRDDGSLQRMILPVIPKQDQAFTDISAKMVAAALQRSECRFFGPDRYYCKGYTGDFCTKQGEQVDNVTSILYNECYLTDEWSDTAPSSASCPPLAPFIRTCIIQKGWDKDVFLAATCYEKQAGPTSPNSAVARLGEVNAASLQAMVDGANSRHVLRGECDFVGSMYYCTGYTAAYCDSQWENKIQSNYWDCHATVTWLGSFRLDSMGIVHLL